MGNLKGHMQSCGGGGKARAVLNNANLTAELRSDLWTECANYVAQMHNVTVKAGREMCPHEEFFGKKPNF
jgi:hypothetical protein